MIHHVTILARNPNKLKKFYGDVLGLSLLQETTNIDDPKTPHLVFGTSQGKMLLTFLVYPKSHRGTVGCGCVSSVSLAVARGSLEQWRQRLRSHKPTEQNGGLSFLGPDGVVLSLIEIDGKGDEILGLHSVQFLCSDRTREFWREWFGSPKFLSFAGSTHKAQLGYGSVHHVALTCEGALVESDVPGLSPAKDREGFRSRYFYDPSDCLWELVSEP